MLFCLPECRKAVCSLTRLTDNDGQRILIQDRTTIAELGSQFHTHWNSRQIFHDILRCHSYMIRRTTGYDINLTDFCDICVRKSYFAQINLTSLYN